MAGVIEIEKYDHNHQLLTYRHIESLTALIVEHNKKLINGIKNQVPDNVKQTCVTQLKQLELRNQQLEQMQVLVDSLTAKRRNDSDAAVDYCQIEEGHQKEANALNRETGKLTEPELAIDQLSMSMRGLTRARQRILCLEQGQQQQLRTFLANKDAMLNKLQIEFDEAYDDYRKLNSQNESHLQESYSKKRDKLLIELQRDIDQLKTKLKNMEDENQKKAEQIMRLRTSGADKQKLIREHFKDKLDDCHKQLEQKDALLHEAMTSAEDKDKMLATLQVQLDETLRKLQNKEIEFQKQLQLKTIENEQLRKDFDRYKSDQQTIKQLAYATKTRQLQEVNMLSEIIVSKTAQKPMKEQEADNRNSAGSLGAVQFGSPRLPDHLRRLKQIYKPLTMKLEAKKAAAGMFQRDALTARELETVQRSNKLIRSAEHLLNIILEIPEQHVYACFLEVLKETNQEHICSWLVNADYVMNNKHMELIQKHYTFLVVTIDAMNGLLAELYSRNVIDSIDKDHLDAESSSSRRNEKLLAMLGRQSFQRFISFIESLDETGQNHVVSVLLGSKESFFGQRKKGTVSPRERIFTTGFNDGEIEEDQMLRQQANTSLNENLFDTFFELQKTFDEKCEGDQEVEEVVHCKTVAELELQLDQLNTKLRDTEMSFQKQLDEKITYNNRLRQDLEQCKLELHRGRELAFMTKQRELEGSKITKEVEYMISQSRLKDAVVELEGITALRSNSKDVNESESPDYHKRMIAFYKQLTSKLEAKTVAAVMFQRDALTIEELESVQRNRDPIKSAERLLDILLRIPKPYIWICFLDTIRERNMHRGMGDFWPALAADQRNMIFSTKLGIPHYTRKDFNEIQEFNDVTFYDRGLHIKGIEFKVVNWYDHPVLGGMKIKYVAQHDSTAQTVIHGNMDYGTPCGFELQDGERIVRADVNAGECIDQMTFRTNSKRTLGPFGGPGGSSYIEDFSGPSPAWLAFFKGEVCTEKNGMVTLRRLQLVWIRN